MAGSSNGAPSVAMSAVKHRERYRGFAGTWLERQLNLVNISPLMFTH
jgi:hypothetical protein